MCNHYKKKPLPLAGGAFFVYKDKILRFCVNESVDFPVEEREPNGVKEKYHIIPQLNAFEFKHLQRWKEK